MKKSVIAILTATVIILSFLGPAFYVATVQAADPAAWYKTVNGVLASDYYSLYPYENKSLDIGFSKFGEVINSTDGLGVGLQYPGYEVVKTYDQKLGTSRDPFANEGVPKKLWLNGWLLEARYTHRTQRDRRVLAMAMFADMTAFGGGWLNGHALPLESAPYGGRKTTGYAETEALQVLYDGPRRFVALSVTHLYDWKDGDNDTVVDHPTETWAILDLKLTFIFEKVKKEVTILKDVKIVISGKELDSPVDVQFSNREQWDLGPSPNWASYAHFYHQQLDTCYGPEWHLAPGIMREYIYQRLGPITGVPVWDEREPYGPPIASGSVRVYVNDRFKEEGVDYVIDYLTGAIAWFISVGYLDEVKVVYKLYKQLPTAGVPHLYDVAQIISSDLKYVGWKAFWPTLSDYTVDGWAMSFIPLINVSDPDILPSEPEIPFVAGEWDFMLGKGYPEQFRGVEVIGLTKRNDADDANILGGANVIDREARYQLNEVFNPWDLVSAVHKETKRWVEWKPAGVTWYTTLRAPVVVVGDDEWDSYCVFSERVINVTTGTLLNRWKGEYGIILNDNGTATLFDLPTAMCKILYSTREIVGIGILASPQGLIQLGLCLDSSGSILPDDWTVIKGGVANAIRYTLPHDGSVELTVVQFSDTAAVEVAPTVIDATNYEIVALTIEGLTQMAGMTAMAAGLNLTWYTMMTSPYFAIATKQVINVATDGLPNILLDPSPTGDAAGDVTWVRDVAATLGLDEIDAEAIGTGPDVTWMQSGLVWPQPGNVAPPYIPGWVEQVPDAAAFAAAVSNKFQVIIPPAERPKGRYEWGIIGRDAVKAPDSGGLSLVSAAFKNKRIEYGIAGEDMFDPEIANQMPDIMNRFGTEARTMADYKDAKGRAALKDDWCTYWPIASSNIIGVGGPLANMLAYYGNDFTDAFFGLNQYTDYEAWENKIIALTCWNGTNSGYSSTSSIGYAVITTYKDINGTVLFLVWGHWGRDTYYATQWLHGDAAREIPPGIIQLQSAPSCLTSIILEVNYTKPQHPTFSIVECLGTISETTWVHGAEVKGGIHEDP